jgi:hypothetical protein
MLISSGLVSGQSICHLNCNKLQNNVLLQHLTSNFILSHVWGKEIGGRHWPFFFNFRSWNYQSLVCVRIGYWWESRKVRKRPLGRPRTFGVPENAGNFLSSCTIGTFSRRAQLHDWVTEDSNTFKENVHTQGQSLHRRCVFSFTFVCVCVGGGHAVT